MDMEKRFEDIIVDPSLHLDTNTRIVYGTGNRSMPDAFKMFTGPLSVAEKPCRRRSTYSEFFYMEQDRLGRC